MLAAHDRIQLALTGGAGDVVGELLDVKGLLLRGLHKAFRGLFLVIVLLFLGGTEKAFLLEICQHAAVIDTVGAEENLAIAVSSAAKGQHKVLGPCGFALHPGCLHHGDAEHVLRLAGEIDVVYLLIGNALPRLDPGVDISFKVRRLHAQGLDGLERHIVFVSDDSKQEMVRADAVAAGAHCLLAGVFDDSVKFF